MCFGGSDNTFKSNIRTSQLSFQQWLQVLPLGCPLMYSEIV